MDSKKIMQMIVKSMDDKKARDIKVLKVEGLTTLTDYFVICSGTSSTQMKAIADGIDDNLSKEKEVPMGREGLNTAYWILLDYGSVIAHIFSEESREFYSIERLWSDAEEIDITDITD